MTLMEEVGTVVIEVVCSVRTHTYSPVLREALRFRLIGGVGTFNLGTNGELFSGGLDDNSEILKISFSVRAVEDMGMMCCD